MTPKSLNNALYGPSRGYTKGKTDYILSKQEEYACIRQYIETKDITCRDKLLLGVLPFIVRIVGRSKRRLICYHDFNDVIHGCILHTIRVFDYLHKFDFKSRLISFIAPAVSRYIWSLTNPVNPKDRGELITNQADSVFEQRRQHGPEELAIRLEEYEHIEQAYNAMSKLNQGRIMRIINGETRHAVALSEGRHHQSIIHSLKEAPQLLRDGYEH